MTQESLKWILKLRSKSKVDMAFDLLLANAYFRGQFNGMMPVEDSREAFEHLKKLLGK
jgi:hypothetical protein